ncbi:MAG: hypothetical protein KVP17_004365 [Porospora cf. gigantea B]|uniref:uncharacterized protein n=2 Tax=Porospora cf. gigantea B TaxID=2853592 RepID=UPI00357189B0|nr:MAG: hypothetical protein KVP17_004365 [Porospora cf. gigantea B]
MAHNLSAATQVPDSDSAAVGSQGTLQRLNVFASTRRSKECPNCHGESIVIYDSHSGDELCSACGLVVESRVMSEEQEWRSFSNSDGGSGGDRSRVGGPSDLWLSDGVQGTSMMSGDSKYQKLMMVHEMATALSSSDRQLKAAFQNLRLIADTFNLRENVVERCKEIVKDLQTEDALKNRTGPLYMLGVVYLACREEGIQKTLKELVGFDRTFTEKELGKATNRLKKLLPQRRKNNPSHFSASEFLPRFCAGLQISPGLCTLAEHIAQRAEPNLGRQHRPNAIAAGAIYFVCQLKHVRLDPQDIAGIAKTTLVAVMAVYKEMFSMKQHVLPPELQVM